MKKHFGDILILILIIWTGAVVSASAQNDSLPDIPLYDNAVSKDVPPSDKRGIINGMSEVNFFGDDELRNFYNYFAAGKYREAVESSKKINTSKFSKNQTQVFYRYAVAAYKEMEFNAEADSLARRFLEKDPLYQPVGYDPSSFREILENYYTIPKFSVWLSTAKNYVKTRVDTVYVITIDTLQREPSYKYDASSVQLGFEYHPIQCLSISIAPTLRFCKYTRSSKRHEWATHFYKERYMLLGLPVRIDAGLYRKQEKFSRKSVSFVPSVFVGIEPKFALRSHYVSYIDVIGQIVDISDEKPNVDTKTRLNYSLFGGVRLSVNHGRLTYFAEVSIAEDMKTVNDSDKKYDTYDALYRDLYINDMFKIRELSMMIGVKLNLKYKSIAKNGYGYVN
ncbi:MAG: hypothetical protein J6U21_12515 [Bacteroidales bacterium]|nr:hypothetical protein [Bacteroidales bacterium]